MGFDVGMRISLNARMSDKVAAMGKHRHREAEPRPLTRKSRIYTAIAGVAILAASIALLVSGREPVRFGYRGVSLYSPVFIVIGLLLIVIGVFPGNATPRK
jgi:hypothetical protein